MRLERQHQQDENIKRSRRREGRKRLSPEAQTQVVPPEKDRPRKLTDKMLALIEAHCLTVNSLQEIADLCCINRSTLLRWRGQFPWLRVMMDRWMAQGKQGIVSKLFAAANRGEKWAIQYILDHRHADYRKTTGEPESWDDLAGDSDQDNGDFSYM